MNDDKELKEIIDVSKAMASGDFKKEFKGELGGMLGSLAQQIDKTRRNLLEVLASFEAAGSEELPGAFSELSDLYQTIDDTSEKLLNLAEEVVGHSDRMSNMVEILRKELETVPHMPPTINEIFQKMQGTAKATKDDFLEILASLSFQDFAGQRIRKILMTIEWVEKKILEFIFLFEVKSDGKESMTKKNREMMKKMKDLSKPLDLKQDMVDEIFEGVGL